MSQRNIIEELLIRSVANILPSKDSLQEALSSGKRLKVYIGADATGPQLHLGHATNFILLEKLRRLGHEAIVLFGDFTAMLGDPTDKSAARVQLTKEQVEENLKTWKEQVGKILDFEDAENPARIVRNSEWLATLDLSRVIELGSHFTVQQMLERDMFEKRIQDGKPIFVHEFLYPMLQGYDSVALDADVEIGGTDQTFNMLAGRTLQRQYHDKEKFVIATTLLEDPRTGKKLMSKSEGGYIALNDTVQDMFGKVMALPDEVIGQMFVDCTHVPLDEVKTVMDGVWSGDANPRDAKLRLASEIVKLYHGEAAAEEARKYFVNTFSKHLVPENIEACEVNYEPTLEGYENLGSFMTRIGLAKSKSDADRKAKQGGVLLGDEKIHTGVRLFSKEDDGKILRVGKKDFRRVIVR